MSDLHRRLTQALEEAMAANAPYFGGGGPGYDGLRVEDVAPDGSAFDLVLTFRSGVRYCCCEPGCHVPSFSGGWWAWLRECVDRQGLAHLPLPVIRTLRGVIEQGAVFDTA